MDTIRIGMIGCGNVGKMQARAMEGLAGARLTAVADSNAVLADEMAARFGCRAFHGYRELLEWGEMDLISICLPPALHCQVATEAARSGLHVMVEKPLEVSPEQADRMIEVCRRQGVKLGSISQHRFDPAIRTLRQLLDQNRLGRLLLGSARVLWYRSPEYYSEGGGWRSTKANQGGVLMSQAIHYIDLLQYLMGDAREVNALCDTLLHDIEVEDTGLAHILFQGGAVGTLEATTIAYPGLESELCLYGEAGSVRIRDDRVVFYAMKSGETIPELERLMALPRSATGAGDPMAIDVTSHTLQFQDMVDAIRQGREPAVNGEEGRKSIALIDAIHRSSQQGGGCVRV